MKLVNLIDQALAAIVGRASIVARTNRINYLIESFSMKLVSHSKIVKTGLVAHKSFDQTHIIKRII